MQADGQTYFGNDIPPEDIERLHEEEVLRLLAEEQRAGRPDTREEDGITRDRIQDALETISGHPPAPEFRSFGKIHRLRREMIITEKIDGTNAAVGVTEDGRVYAQSRKRLITPDADNMGFARWVQEHEDELGAALGEGLHFGEWWGQGIQRKYGLDHKRFSLFNVARWRGEDTGPCHVVPVLGTYDVFDTVHVSTALERLRSLGSHAAPGYDNPEGVVIFHKAANTLFKQTLEGDDHGKEYGA